jgi:hypothetical protein
MDEFFPSTMSLYVFKYFIIILHYENIHIWLMITYVGVGYGM